MTDWETNERLRKLTKAVNRLASAVEKLTGGENPSLDVPVASLPLSARARNCLYEIDTVGDLIQKTPRELLTIRAFGQRTLREVKQCLSDRDLNLACAGLE